MCMLSKSLAHLTQLVPTFDFMLEFQNAEVLFGFIPKIFSPLVLNLTDLSSKEL